MSLIMVTFWPNEFISDFVALLQKSHNERFADFEWAGIYARSAERKPMVSSGPSLSVLSYIVDCFGRSRLRYAEEGMW